MRRWLADQGVVVDVVAEQEIDRPVLGWLEQSATGASAAALVSEAFEAELARGATTGMRPHWGTDGAMWFRQHWELTTARMPLANK